MSLLQRVQERERLLGTQELSGIRETTRQRLKRDLVTRLGLQTVAALATQGDVAQARMELRVACQALCNGGGYEDLAPDERLVLAEQVVDEICGYGPLQPLLDSDRVTEIMVNGAGALFYEEGGKLRRAERVFENDEQILMVIDRILAPLGRRLDERSPIVNARLPNGFRVNAVASSVAIDGTAVTIRKFSDDIVSLEQLVELSSLPSWYAQLLAWAVRMRCDIAVAGGTGSGKTTLLNALSREVAFDERIVTIEDSAELRFEADRNLVRLEAREASLEGSGAITIRDLVKNALRMRPDRIIVGEVRGSECIDMLQAMNTGHDGSLTTLHAGTADEAILRLVLMARFGMDLPAHLIEEQVATALDLIVMSARLPDGTRVISSLHQVERSHDGGAVLKECVSFDRAARRWQLADIPSFLEQAVEEARIGEEEMLSWMSSCSA